MKKNYFLFYLFLLSNCYSDYNPDLDYATIQQLNRKMEQLYNDGHPAALADFYQEDATIIGPDDELIGRDAIREYWQKMSYPVSLNIETLIMKENPDSIFQTYKWQELKISISKSNRIKIRDAWDSGAAVFQLARIKTAYEREDVTVFTKETTALLGWTKTDNGYFRMITTCFLD